jgi:hypothetical protein
MTAVCVVAVSIKNYRDAAGAAEDGSQSELLAGRSRIFFQVTVCLLCGASVGSLGWSSSASLGRCRTCSAPHRSTCKCFCTLTSTPVVRVLYDDDDAYNTMTTVYLPSPRDNARGDNDSML